MSSTFTESGYCRRCQQKRNASMHYFERMKRNENNLANIRSLLGVSNKPNRFTLQRIEDLMELAAESLEREWAEEAHKRMFA